MTPPHQAKYKAKLTIITIIDSNDFYNLNSNDFSTLQNLYNDLFNLDLHYSAPSSLF